MNKTEFDEKMKNMLHECADDLHAPDTMKTRVDFALRSAQVKPRHRWGKRIAVLAAVAAIAVTGAFAAGGFGSITSHSWANQRMSLAQTQEHMEQAGVEFTLPERIGGFTFSHGYDADTLAESAAGEREQVFDGEDDPYAPDAERDVNGVTLAFRDTAYLFVPPDYQPTDEEKQQERAGELAISYGSDQVENTQFQSVSWTQDGVEYSLSGFDTGLDSEEMLSMAAELVK